MPERTYAVRYIGEGVRNVPDIGVFQQGTIVYLPEARVRSLIRDPDFSLVGWSHVPTARFQAHEELPPEPEEEVEKPDWEKALEDSDILDEEEEPEAQA